MLALYDRLASMASPHVSFQAVRRPGRPPARGGPTIDGKQASRKGWPHRRSRKPVRRPGRPPARGGPTIYDSFPGGPSRPSRVGPPLAGGLGGAASVACFPSIVGPPLAGGLGGSLDDGSPGGPSRPSIVGPPLAGGLGGAASVACFPSIVGPPLAGWPGRCGIGGLLRPRTGFRERL